jgi:SEC-C motif domain protein
MTCFCGLGESLATCCGPYLARETWPATALALMRARYTAYVTGDIAFIVDTHHPSTAHTVDRAATEAWSKNAEWLGLTIVASEAGKEDDETGTVEFQARYKMDGVIHTHAEHSRFEKSKGKWFFVDGKQLQIPATRPEGPGRNAPCPCGSGLKFKRCCGKA